MFCPFSFTHKQLSFSHHYCTVNLWLEVCQDFLLAWVERVKLMDLQMCFEMWHEDEMAFKGLSSSGQVFKSLRAHTLSFSPTASCCPGYSTKTFGLSHLTALYDWITSVWTAWMLRFGNTGFERIQNIFLNYVFSFLRSRDLEHINITY